MSATEGRWTDFAGTIGKSSKTPGDSHTVGDDLGVFVIHAVLLNTGKVLWFSGHAETVHYLPEAWVWDPAKPPSTAVRKNFPFDPVQGHHADAFCCHHVVLEDGRVLTAGGAAASPDDGRGIRAICTFDPVAESWAKIGDMTEARWYPTLVTLPDERVLAFSGHTAPGVTPLIAPSVELLRPPFVGPSFTTQTLTGANKELHIYPGLHLVKGGKIFYTGTNWRYEPMLLPAQPQTPAAGTPIGTFSFRVTGAATGAWTDEGISPNLNLREEGTSILLPPAQDGKILLLGGCRAIGHANTFTGLAPGSNPRSAEILDTQASPLAWTPAGPAGQMNFPRINASAVLLPDGTVLIIGGHDSHKWAPSTANPPAFNPTPDFHSPNHFTLRAEIFDPSANTFTQMAQMQDPRTYHSACLLLPDGRVLCAGGVNSDHSEAVPGGRVTLNQKTMEFYEPVYFFKTQRPTITSVSETGGPNDHIRYDGNFVIQTPDANNIEKVVLLRPGAMTHHTDSEQRLVTLEVVSKESGKIKVRVLNDPTVAPPGFYMLWIVDNKQMPCQRAVFVRLSHRRVRLLTTRCNFSKREVETLLAAGTPVSFDNALEVAVEGFLPNEVGVTTATPSPQQLAAIAPAIAFSRPNGTVVPEVAAVARVLTVQDTSLPAGLRQRFTFTYAVEFTGLAAFADVTEDESQNVRVTAGKAGFSDERIVTLFQDVAQRFIVTLRRTTGDRFVSTKIIEVIGACDNQAETDSTVFVPGTPGGFLRAGLATMTDEVNVVV